MKILLCNPNTHKPVFNQAGRLGSLTGTCPPLGIGYLAAVLLADGHDVVLYDWMGCPDEEIEKALRRERPRVVGVSCFTLTRGAALAVAELAKRLDPAVHVVFGGSHATALPEQMLAHYPAVDAIVMGEGEWVFRDWICHLESGGDPVSAPAGVAFRVADEVRVMPRADFIADLDMLPFPVRDLANDPPYKPFPEEYPLGKLAAMLASRGCPYRCLFCSTSVYWGGQYRMRGVDQVIAEMRQLVEGCGVEYIEILDDALTVSREWISRFCAEIRRLGLAVDWGATTRVNYVDEALCRMMRKAGCVRMNLGIESFSARILKSIRKGITSEQAEQAIRWGKNAGIRVNALLMVGNPGESWETIQDNVQAVGRARPHGLIVNPTQVYPQTKLYELAKQGGLLDDAYWLDLSRAAPIYTVERSVEELAAFARVLADAHWASRWTVRLYRKSGLRRLRHWLKPAAPARVEAPASGAPAEARAPLLPAGEPPPVVWYMAAGYGLPAGIEAHILHYAREMKLHGFEPRVVVFESLPLPRHRFLHALDEADIPVLSLRESARVRIRVRRLALLVPWYLYILFMKRRRPNVRSFRTWVMVRESIRELARRLRRDEPDVVHVFGRLPTDAWAQLPADRTIFHEMMTGTVGRSWTEDELADFRAFANRAARVFAPGVGVARNLIREFGITREVEPIFTMCPDEVGAASLARPVDERDGRVRFGILCRFTEQKGISYLLDALLAFEQRHGSVDFTFAGQGELEPDMRAFAERHGMDGVRIVKVADAAAVLRAIDVFVHPSVGDAMPMSIAEALMCGCPCVVCDVGGCPDLVRDGQEGFVITPRQVDQILDRMERFAAMSRADLDAFRQRARDRFEEVCLPAKVGEVVAGHYRHILEDAGRQHEAVGSETRVGPPVETSGPDDPSCS